MLSMTETKLSPMMTQWEGCKKQAGSALLLFRLGDFYEAFYEDAEILAKELQLTLTKRHDVPMSGLPAHTSDPYIDRLVAKGYRVAIAEQVEDPKEAKGLVKREIVRIITPGTVIQSSLLSAKSNNFIVCITPLNQAIGLAILDLTTAEFRVTQMEGASHLLDELARLSPAEILISEKGLSLIADKGYHCHVKNQSFFDPRTACEKLLRHFKVHTLDGFGLKEWNGAVLAAGSLLCYVSEELGLSIHHITTLKTEPLANYMTVDGTTKRHLELPHLLEHLDHTLTPMGGRLLKMWLYHPLLSPEMIGLRQEAVALLIHYSSTQAAHHLSEIGDLERLMMRIETGYASPRDLISLAQSLEHVPPLSQLLEKWDTPLLQKEREKLCDVSPLTEKIQKALVSSPPMRLSEGGIFRKGYHADLDALTQLKDNNHTWIASYQESLKEETQIKTLKVGYTQAFGYYIEVSRGQAQKMGGHFERRQTLVNTERYTTPELKEYERKILSAEDRIKALEGQLFLSLRLEVAAESQKVRAIASAIAHIDSLHSLAQCAIKHRYIRPTVNEGEILHLKGGRHPVLAAKLPTEKFIPNDLHLNPEERLMLITGPNMAGKSTYIRQIALLVIMAQIGSFIPAESATIGIIDRLFSRIGASDDLERGQSTFMVEMTETANILNNLTSRSLVILDEIGRGTSTYDGISIAWAVAEFLLTQKDKKAKTLFATHYWELTQLEDKVPGAVNFHIAVHEASQNIVFLHKIVRGGTDRSYGIHVAKLAALPAWVIKRAQEMLSSLEKKRPTRPPSAPKEQQLDIFAIPHPHPLIEEIKRLDPHHLTPLEALQKIMNWKHALQ